MVWAFNLLTHAFGTPPLVCRQWWMWIFIYVNPILIWSSCCQKNTITWSILLNMLQVGSGRSTKSFHPYKPLGLWAGPYPTIKYGFFLYKGWGQVENFCRTPQQVPSDITISYDLWCRGGTPLQGPWWIWELFCCKWLDAMKCSMKVSICLQLFLQLLSLTGCWWLRI